MKLYLTPNKRYKRCFVIIGGSGDNAETLKPLVEGLCKNVTDINFCTFSFTANNDEKNVFNIQIKELNDVCTLLLNDYNFESLIIFCTSMGAVATIGLLQDKQISSSIEKVIFFDPADYYLTSSDINHTWSGIDQYQPDKAMYSDSLKKITSGFKIDVVHLTLRNYGKNGYLSTNYLDRGDDNQNGFSRLNTQMVKAFYDKTPTSNKGKYVEVNNIPHAILRDGYIEKNIKSTVKIVKSLL